MACVVSVFPDVIVLLVLAMPPVPESYANVPELLPPVTDSTHLTDDAVQGATQAAPPVTERTIKVNRVR